MALNATDVDPDHHTAAAVVSGLLWSSQVSRFPRNNAGKLSTVTADSVPNSLFACLRAMLENRIRGEITAIGGPAPQDLRPNRLCHCQ